MHCSDDPRAEILVSRVEITRALEQLWPDFLPISVLKNKSLIMVIRSMFYVIGSVFSVK